MTDIDAPMRYAPPAADRTEREGSVGLVILLALALAAAAVGLAMVSREMAERRIYPAIDIAKSGTRKEEKLLPADVVVTRYVPPTPCTEANVWSHLLFGDVEAHVRTVFVDGERVLDEGVSTRLDETQLRAQLREHAAGLWERFRRATPRWEALPLGEGT